jgi:hypothetical protein
MTRNQKIALGCGGAGCLGLIVVAIAGGLLYFFAIRPAAYRAASRNYNYNSNYNSNFNINSNSDENSNSNSSIDSNSNANANSDSSTSASSMSDDDKHKLFHAATMTGETELITRVNVKLGLWKDDHTPGDNYQQFATEHAIWVFQNLDWVRTISTTEKAKAYVEEHLP